MKRFFKQQIIYFLVALICLVGISKSVFAQSASPKAQGVRVTVPINCTQVLSGMRRDYLDLLILSQSMINKLNSNEKNVDNYYQTVMVPAGKTVDNYQELSDSVRETAKAIQTGYDRIKLETAKLSCNDKNINSTTLQLNNDIQSQIDLMLRYKQNLSKEISVLLDVDSSPAGSSPSLSPSPTPSFDEQSKKTRDEQRLADLEDLKIAITAVLKNATSSSALALCSSATLPCGGSSNSLRGHVSDIDGGGWVKVDISKQTVFPFITLPLDPLNNDNFFYQYKSDKVNLIFSPA